MLLLKILLLIVFSPIILAGSVIYGLFSEGFPLIWMILYGMFQEQPKKSTKRHPYSKNYLKAI
jgi:hypothetical protein